MGLHAIVPSVVTFSTLVSGSPWQAALALLQNAEERAVLPDTILVCSTVSAVSCQWPWALLLAESMHLWALAPSLVAYNAALSALAAELWERALGLFSKLSSDLQLDSISCGATMSSFSPAMWQEALDLLSLTSLRRLQLSVVSYGLAARAAAWRKSLAVLPELLRRGMKVELATCGAVLSSCEKASQWRQTLDTLNQQQQHRAWPQPNVVAYSAAIAACEKARNWPMALHLLRSMSEIGIQPDLVALNSALSACPWELALCLGEVAVSHSMQLNTVSYNILLSALSVGQSFSQSRELEVLEDMRRSLLQPDVVTYNTLLSATLRRADWQAACGYLEEMPQVLLAPDEVSFATALATCDQAKQWQVALRLLAQMRRQRLAPERAEESALAACERAGQWQRTLALASPRSIRGLNTALRAAGQALLWALPLLLLARAAPPPDAKSFAALAESAEAAQVELLPRWLHHLHTAAAQNLSPRLLPCRLARTGGQLVKAGRAHG
ncbi:unnamed protein product [Effrenium voratum]|nr:unnamed protein product [Effrenium voratum]